MYNQTVKQVEAEKRLEKEGFRFSNWVPTDPCVDGEYPGSLQGNMVMVRKPNRYTTDYREIDPEGNIN